MAIFGKLGTYIIAILTLILLLLFFFSPEEGAFGKLKWSVEKIKGYLPFKTGIKPLAGGQAAVPSQHQVEINKLKEAIRKMSASQKSNCFYQFNEGGFSSLGEDGTVIQLTYDETTRSTKLSVEVLGGKHYVTNMEDSFPGIKPCVIAGDTAMVKRFYGRFIDKSQGGVSDIFRSVKTIKINFYTGTGINTCFDGNVIRVKEFGENIVNSACKNFDSNGWLFTPDNKHICFFPTNWESNADEDGIDNKRFMARETDSIPSLVKRGELTACS